MRKLMGVVSAAALLAGFGNTSVAQADQYVYPVKYVCGYVRLKDHVPSFYEALVPGWYATAINHDQPNEKPVKMDWHATLTHGDNQGNYNPHGSEDFWEPRHAFEIDCRDLYKDGKHGEFIKGIYYITTDHPVDIVAVYSAAPYSDAHGNTRGVSSMQVLPIEGRRVGNNGWAGDSKY